MFHTFFDFRSLGIIEAVYCAYEIAGDSSDPLELYTLADFAIYILYLCCVHNVPFRHKKPATA